MENEPKKTVKRWLIDIEFKAIEWLSTSWIFFLSAFKEKMCLTHLKDQIKKENNTRSWRHLLFGLLSTDLDTLLGILYFISFFYLRTLIVVTIIIEAFGGRSCREKKKGDWSA